MNMKRSFSDMATNVTTTTATTTVDDDNDTTTIPINTQTSTTPCTTTLPESPRKRQSREGLEPLTFAENYLSTLTTPPQTENHCGILAEKARALYKASDLSTLRSQGVHLSEMSSSQRRLANNRRSARGTKVYDRVLERAKALWIEGLVEENGRLKGKVQGLEGEVERLKDELRGLEKIRGGDGGMGFVEKFVGSEKMKNGGEEKGKQEETMTTKATDESEGKEIQVAEKVGFEEETEGKEKIWTKEESEFRVVRESVGSTSVLDPLMVRCSEEADGDLLAFLNSQNGGGLWSSQGFSSQGFGGFSLSQGLCDA